MHPPRTRSQPGPPGTPPRYRQRRPRRPLLTALAGLAVLGGLAGLVIAQLARPAAVSAPTDWPSVTSTATTRPTPPGQPRLGPVSWPAAGVSAGRLTGLVPGGGRLGGRPQRLRPDRRAGRDPARAHRQRGQADDRVRDPAGPPLVGAWGRPGT